VSIVRQRTAENAAEYSEDRIFMGASIPEFPGFTKQILGHAAHYPARNGKSSPAMISEDKSVRIFDRHIRHP
jgi:hypothetical protein